jgi:glycerol-3-phosphate acyltransferase PlsY
MWIRHEPAEHLVFGTAAVVLAFYRHRANIRRLARGEELPIIRRRDSAPNG